VKNLKFQNEHIKDLLIKLLDPNPSTRITSDQALQHEYFNSDKQVIMDLMQINKLFADQKTKTKLHILSREFRGHDQPPIFRPGQ
jgi:serine/threonine protein kinase